MIHKFVEYIPENIEDNVIYISVQYSTVSHNCCCGCGNKVVTPLSPTDWNLSYNGETVSIYPSIGNWGFPCQSHYWIRDNKIKWSRKWSKDEIVENHKKDVIAKENFYNKKKIEYNSTNKIPLNKSTKKQPKKLLWSKLFNKNS